YILPTTGRIPDLHRLETCAAGRTKKRDTKTIPFDVSSFPQHNSCSYSVTSKIMLPVKHRNKKHL
ncbi:hypothetical protein, partial [Hungatella hathewayi]|uniref:hypothetical protein n=2 Tax=Hungatella TaxID=1649459 RepID=UPI003562ED51